MDINEIGKLFITILPVLITGYFGYMVANKKAEKDKLSKELEITSSAQDKFRDDYLARLDKVEEKSSLQEKEIINLNIRLSELSKDHAMIEIERDALQQTVANYERREFDSPFPSWIKREDGFMLELNRSYEKLLLEPHGKTKSDYLNRYDKDIHSFEAAENYREHDQLVYNKGMAWVGKETYIKADGTTATATAAKWQTHTVNGMRAIKGMILITRLDVFETKKG